MEEIYGILHKDYSSSHYIVLDDYFTKEQQLYFFDYFNKQQEEFGWYTEDDALDLQGQGDILEGEFILTNYSERFDGKIEYISEFIDYLRDSNMFKNVNRFQVIRQNTILQHRDGDESVYEHVSDGMISPDGDFFTTNLWRFYYWFWFRLSDDKKMFFGKNKDIEFRGRGMIYNGMDYHGSPDMGGNTNQWSILMKGLPTEDLSKHFNLK